ncbi:O-antigen ligase family protein [Staphylococcus sp. EZ-P03]|uniref:O-antigen ligase family protein n=1 Tax=Staphylococcus sp. EZ-P03 TaxID=2282739 RepID=UPI000DF78467|nr:O-antigen ligase family protein [Staphylococcus sp. EZ-P03]
MKKTLFYINLFLIFILQFISEVVSPIPTVVFGILCITAFLLVSTSHLMGLYLFLIPLSSGMVLYLTNVLFLIFIIIHFRGKLDANKNFIIISLLILFESIHVFINVNLGLDESIIKLLGFSACLLLFGFIKTLAKNINVTATLNFLIAGVLGFILITTGIYMFKYNISTFFTEIKRFGFVPYKKEEGLEGLIINPNTVGKYCAFIISSILTLNYFRIIKLNLLRISIITVFSIVGLLTLSRSFLLVMILILVMYLWFSIRSGRVFPVFVFGVVLTIFAVILITNTELYMSLTNRIFESDDISGSRFTIYSIYISILMSNGWLLLFGTGMQNYVEKYAKYDYLIDQATHNILLEVVSIWGVIGLLLVALLLVRILSNSMLGNIRSIDRYILLLPFFVVIISALFGQFFISYYHTFGIAIFSLVILSSNGVVKND